MKKHNTIPGEPEEMPEPSQKPEIERPADPKEPEIPGREITEVPQELPPDKGVPNERPPQTE
jgi:hypothetical protein